MLYFLLAHDREATNLGAKYLSVTVLAPPSSPQSTELWIDSLFSKYCNGVVHQSILFKKLEKEFKNYSRQSELDICWLGYITYLIWIGNVEFGVYTCIQVLGLFKWYEEWKAHFDDLAIFDLCSDNWILWDFNIGISDNVDEAAKWFLEVKRRMELYLKDTRTNGNKRFRSLRLVVDKLERSIEY